MPRCKQCGRHFTYNSAVGYAKDLCGPLCDGIDSQKKTIADLRTRLAAAEADAANMRLRYGEACQSVTEARKAQTAAENRCEELEAENRQQLDLHNEIVRRLQSDVAELDDLRDCKESLRELGRHCGCDHVESPDERQLQVRHIEEAFDRLQQEVERLRRIVEEIWDMFYGQGYEVANWHLNGDLESIDHFFEDNDWAVEAAEASNDAGDENKEASDG